MRNEEVTAERRWMGTAESKRAGFTAHRPVQLSHVRRPPQRARAAWGQITIWKVLKEPIDHYSMGGDLQSGRETGPLAEPDGF